MMSHKFFCRTWQESKRALGEGLELFLPASCACCGIYGQGLAGSWVLCPRCDFLLRRSLLKLHFPVLKAYMGQVVCAGTYDYELARGLLAFKNGGRTDLLTYFQAALLRCLRELLTEQTVRDSRVFLVPVPSSLTSIHRRGFAPADLLARSLLAKFSPTWPRSSYELKVIPALKKRSLPPWLSQHQGQQKLLSGAARLNQAFRQLELARPPLGFLGLSYELEGTNCILIDDVVTTGASLQAATRLLQDAGAHVLGACAVASVPLRNQQVVEENL